MNSKGWRRHWFHVHRIQRCHLANEIDRMRFIPDSRVAWRALNAKLYHYDPVVPLVVKTEMPVNRTMQGRARLCYSTSSVCLSVRNVQVASRES